jgi:hypothetical protein
VLEPLFEIGDDLILSARLKMACRKALTRWANSYCIEATRTGWSWSSSTTPIHLGTVENFKGFSGLEITRRAMALVNSSTRDNRNQTGGKNVY